MTTSETLFVLDLDRTMANTRLYDEAEGALRQVLRVDYEAMKRVRQATESSGGSFNFISYLTENHIPTEEFLRVFAERAAQLGHEAFRNEGASKLLAWLQARQISYIFMTYGGEAWQRSKLAAAGYDAIPVVITDSKQKGRIIAARQMKDGWFTFKEAAVRARHVVLVDDKATAFEGLPSHASGFLLNDPAAEQLVSQRGLLPQHVQTVSSLVDIMKQ